LGTGKTGETMVLKEQNLINSWRRVRKKNTRTIDIMMNLSIEEALGKILTHLQFDLYTDKPMKA
jgi:hypothetical protein